MAPRGADSRRRRLDSARVPLRAPSHRRRATFTALVAGRARRRRAGGGPHRGGRDASRHPRRPNILFVLADDLDLAEMRYLPHVRALIATTGHHLRPVPGEQLAVLPVAHHDAARASTPTTPACGPTAATTAASSAPTPTAWSRTPSPPACTGPGTRPRSRASTSTAIPTAPAPDDVPPGWDHWASAVYGNPYSEYGYVLNQDQAYHVHHHRPRDYGTDVYVGLTDRFIRGAARAHRPFFAFLSVYTPHQPATPAPEDRRRFRARAHLGRRASTRPT